MSTAPALLPRTVLASALLAAALAPAAAQTVSFRILPPASKPKLAEPFGLRIELTCPSDYTVRPDTAAFQNDVFELLGIKKASSSEDGPDRTETFDLRASAFDIGLSTFPETTWLLEKGTDTKEAKSPAFQLEILPQFDASSDTGDIKDIRPPFALPPWPWLLAGILAAVLAAWLIYRRYSRRAAAAAAAAAADTRSPYQKASDALDELAASGIWEDGRAKEFYSRLAGILRSYLNAQFSIKAELMTTARITRELRGTGADINAIVRTRELLERSDLAKFAKFKPGDRDHDSDIPALRELLLYYSQKAGDKTPSAGPGTGRSGA